MIEEKQTAIRQIFSHSVGCQKAKALQIEWGLNTSFHYKREMQYVRDYFEGKDSFYEPSPHLSLKHKNQVMLRFYLQHKFDLIIPLGFPLVKTSTLKPYVRLRKPVVCSDFGDCPWAGKALEPRGYILDSWADESKDTVNIFWLGTNNTSMSYSYRINLQLLDIDTDYHEECKKDKYGM